MNYLPALFSSAKGLRVVEKLTVSVEPPSLYTEL